MLLLQLFCMQDDSNDIELLFSKTVHQLAKFLSVKLTLLGAFLILFLFDHTAVNSVNSIQRLFSSRPNKNPNSRDFYSRFLDPFNWLSSPRMRSSNSLQFFSGILSQHLFMRLLYLEPGQLASFVCSVDTLQMEISDRAGR